METQSKLRTHWDNHKTKYYIAGGVVLAVGIGFAAGYGVRSVKSVDGDLINQSMINILSKGNVQNVTVVKPKGHPGNIIEDVKTGVRYLSQNDARKALGLTTSEFVKKINAGLLINHGANSGMHVV